MDIFITVGLSSSNSTLGKISHRACRIAGISCSNVGGKETSIYILLTCILKPASWVANVGKLNFKSSGVKC